MVSRWALAPVAACGEATKPGLAPNGLTKSAVSKAREGEQEYWGYSDITVTKNLLMKLQQPAAGAQGMPSFQSENQKETSGHSGSRTPTPCGTRS